MKFLLDLMIFIRFDPNQILHEYFETNFLFMDFEQILLRSSLEDRE